jgi:hypothetical protein
MSTPVRVVAMSDEAKMLRKRQAQLYDTDSTEVFTEVSNRLRVLLEKEGDEEDIYKVWSNHVFYLLSHVSSKQALEVADEMKDYATRHDSKYGFYLATISNAYIASSMGLTDRTEELLLQSIDYQKRYLPNERPSAQV